MLERFKVPKEDEVKISYESLLKTVTAVFEKMGVNSEDAALGADVLVSTDLRGVETHGVSNMLREYVNQYNKGTLNPRPEWQILREFPGTATIDADRGLAVILGPKAMQLAIDKAKVVGVGIVTMYNAGHSGAIGHHAMIAAKQDMVGVCMTAGGLLVPPTFGAEPKLGTNPIAIAAPANSEAPFLFDAATSAIAGNKVALAKRVGANLLAGWVSDVNGTPLTEDSKVPERGDYHILPLGGTREQGSHKGYGFSLMAEILTTIISGDVPSMLAKTPGASHHNFIAYNIAAFTDLEIFKSHMDAMLKNLRETPAAPGHERVYYPGLSEHEEEGLRRKFGVPLHKEVVEWFDGISGELSVPALRVL